MYHFQTSLSCIAPPSCLSFFKTPTLFSPHPALSHLSFNTQTTKLITTTIRMGGGPRTYPGGVTKWKWKRMQAKKAKEILKARLCREKQIYEMRKRAERKAAVAELERPWEVVEKAPKLFSVSSDEQLKALANRFQRPRALDLWSEKDGPQLFEPGQGSSSARFFPKDVVHNLRPYHGIDEGLISDGENCEQRNEFGMSRKGGSRWKRLNGGGSVSEDGELLPSHHNTDLVNEVSESSFGELNGKGIRPPVGRRNQKSSVGKFQRNGNRRIVTPEGRYDFIGNLGAEWREEFSNA